MWIGNHFHILLRIFKSLLGLLLKVVFVYDLCSAPIAHLIRNCIILPILKTVSFRSIFIQKSKSDAICHFIFERAKSFDKLNYFEVILIKFSVCLCKKVWSHRTNKFWGVITGICLVNKLLQYNTKFWLPYPYFHSHKRRAMGCTPNSFFRWHLFLRTKSFELFQRPLVQQRSKLCSMSNHRENDSL